LEARVTDVVIIAGAVIAFGLMANLTRGRPITPPMVFTAIGLLAGPRLLGLVDIDVGNEGLRMLAEATLVVVLFTDATRMQIHSVWRGHNLPLRLLVPGLPLAIAFGAVAAHVVIPSLGWTSAALLAAILAPTDAALGQAVVTDAHVPARIRQTLNVESGLNDGLAVPFIALFVDIAAHREASVGGFALLLLQQVGIGVVIGAAVGGAGGWLLGRTAASGWSSGSSQRLTTLGLAAGAYAGAEVAHGNGFIAAFVAGLVVAAASPDVLPRIRVFAETEGELLTLVTFLLFGAAVVGGVLEDVSWRILLYAAISLTLVRLCAVGLSLLRTRLHRSTILFIAWFGPRGLASIVFALLVVESDGVADRTLIFTIATWTVIGSIFLHGLTASLGAKAYGKRMRGRTGPEQQDVPEVPQPLHGGP
jgi:sodium/hydrogen antiporter